MRYSRHSRLHPTGWFAILAVTATLFWGSEASADRFPPDPVEALRLALAIPIRDPLKNQEEGTFRRKNLTERVKDLKTLGQLRRALSLLEWRDEDRDVNVAQIDRPIRLSVANRFRQEMREVLATGARDSQLAALNMLGEMGTSELESVSQLNPLGFVSTRVAGTHAGVARALAPDVVKLAQGDSGVVRDVAVRTLGKINPDPTEASPAFRDLLKSSAPTDRQAAAEGINNLTLVARQIARHPGITDEEKKDVMKIGRVITGVAVAGLTDADPVVRHLCAESIQFNAGSLADLISEPPSTTLRSFPPPGRTPTADELTDMREYRKEVEDERNLLLPFATALKDVTPAMTAVLRDADTTNRLIAAHALEDIAEAHRKFYRRLASVPAIPNEKVDKPAAEAAKNGEKDNAEPPAAIKAEDPLQEGLRRALPGILKGFDDPDARVRLAVLDAVETIAGDAAPAVPGLINLLRDPDLFVRWAAVRVLGKVGPVGNPDKAVAAMAQILFDRDLEVRIAAGGALERYGPAAAPAVGALAEVLRNGDSETRFALLKALDAIGTAARPAIPAIAAVLAERVTGAPRVRAEVVSSLGEQDVRVRRAAAELLGRFGPVARAEAEAALRHALNDREAEVRKAAADALLHILPQPAAPDK